MLHWCRDQDANLGCLGSDTDEECDCNECVETPEEEGPLGSPESPSSEDPKN